MSQRTMLTPDGGIPADCTDSWSEEQALTQAVQRDILAQVGRIGNEEEVWLQLPRASPLPLKRRGVRRAKAQSCHAAR
jgi:hypothetical protein